MLPIGSPLKPSQIDLLMLHGRLQLNDYRWICCENDEVFIKEEKIPLAQAFGWGQIITRLCFIAFCHIRCVISILQNTEISMARYFG